MKLSLNSGAYSAKSLIANAQRCVNLYPEINPQETQPEDKVTHYPRPGLNLLVAPVLGSAGLGRGLYRASNGDLYCVIGSNVIYVSPDWVMTVIGTIQPGNSICCFADNGQTNGNLIVLVDGSPLGYTIDMTTRAFDQIDDPSFVGADRVDYLDTFFLFNQPGTNLWYVSLSESALFDPLDIAGKVGYPDPIVFLMVMHREVWLVGSQRGEVWYDSGDADFAFQSLPGVFIQQGCAAKYSAARQDRVLFWLSLDENGQAMIVRNEEYAAKRISTHALESEIQSYSKISDAIGYCYQQEGHAFYVINFPTANKTWCYDLATDQWHERNWLTPQGVLVRERPVLQAFAYGQNVVLDWQNGNLYKLDQNSFTDNGNPIVCIRSFPHVQKDGKRISYPSFIADMETGSAPGTATGGYFINPFSPGFDSGFGPNTFVAPPELSLRWSDDRGYTWGNYVKQQFGAAGEYITSLKWSRTGMARDRVFELSWSVAMKTALDGAWIEPREHAT